MDPDEPESSFSSCLPAALFSRVQFTPSISPSPRRLSSCFMQPNKPVRAKKQLAWVSLQGRLIGAEEASSVKTIDRNGALGAKEAVAWELFSPIQRVLVVAVVAAAAMDSRKEKRILKLQKSVELRDQVLLSMQQKLDNLCAQVNQFKDQTEANDSVTKRVECGCKPCQHHGTVTNDNLANISGRESNEDEVFEYKTPLCNVTEPDERRMSDLSDWAPSVNSSVDLQMDALSIEYDINSLWKEREEKAITIKSLSSFLQSPEFCGSKRIAEYENIIRRKNMIITKLRKEILILDQKVVNLTRLKRNSSSVSRSNHKQLPFMADNMLYDMDSTTSPSSDSDTSSKNQTTLISREISVQDKDSKCGQKIVQDKRIFTPNTPLKEKPLNQLHNSVSPSKPKHMLSAGAENKSRRRAPSRAKEVHPHKRWA